MIKYGIINLYIQKSKRNNTIYYYLSKSTRDKNSKRSITNVVESLGSREDLIKKHGKNIDQWLKDYAKKRTQEELNKWQEVNIKQNKLCKETSRTKNIGYLIIKLICEEVGLLKICKYIQEKEKLKFDLFNVVFLIICRDLLDDSFSKNLFSFSKSLYSVNIPKKTNLTKTIKLLCKYNAYIQIYINKLLRIKVCQVTV